jgi:bifunctional DNA-binding transcriptional regulator/antitoxin component of YhaV-PrlF toxin-antitoxin module
MSKGLERRIDELGRITIPMEYRKAIGAMEKERLGMYVESNILHLFKVDDDFVGFARCLDELGRWTLPIEIRRTLNCDIRQKMDIYIDSSSVFDNTKVICVSKCGCSWCNNTDHLMEVKGHMLCNNCANDVVDEVHKQRSSRA